MCYNLQDFYANNEDELSSLRLKLEELFTGLEAVYTIKGRVKKYDSLCAKVQRKKISIHTEEDLKNRITDLVGVRLMYLIGDNFSVIHEYIMSLVAAGVFVMHELPQAYTYDSDYEDTYSDLGILVKTKESRYTSVHYTVKLAGVSDFCCEIQVRSLFEEAWCEIEHLVNYPEKSSNPVCRRNLKSLAKLVQKSNKLVNSVISQSKLDTIEPDVVKFEVGKTYNYDSFFGDNLSVIVLDRTLSTITVSHGIDKESGHKLTKTFDIEVFNGIENVLIEVCVSNENYLSAENVSETSRVKLGDDPEMLLETI